MQAITYRHYGAPDVLRLEAIAEPVPGPGDVMVRVHAASINAADAYLLRGEPPLLRLSAGLRRPKHPILGSDIAGQVVAVGNRVTQFQPGDEVYGDLSGCGLGGFAEYVCAPEGLLARKPARLTFEQAAATPMAAVTALQGLRAGGQIAPGRQILIHGASGGVGLFALQLAGSSGATVTAVCSTRNIERVRALGAHHVIDYTNEDFTRHGRRYDQILAANGDRLPWEYRRVLRPGGCCIVSGGTMRQIMSTILLGPLLSLASDVTVRNLLAQPDQRDLATVAGLLDMGEITPIIDRCYPLADLPEAMRYFAAGHAQGKVVITI